MNPKTSVRTIGAAYLELAAVLGVLVVALLLGYIFLGPSEVESPDSLLLYCAAGIKPPVSEIAKMYEEEYGVEISTQYGGSGTLLSNLKVSRQGDLYLAADSSYTDLARKEGLVAEVIPLARLRPVIAFREGNPKEIESLEDLFRKDVRVALADPEAAAIGRTTRTALETAGRWKDLKEKTKVFKPTVNDVANDLHIDAVDAGVIWDATARQYDDIDFIDVPALATEEVTISIGVLETTSSPASSLKFCRYLGAPEKGLRVFEKHGYDPVEGDAWAERPDVLFFSGGVNRLAVQDTVRRFEEREGVRMNCQYNGCGILVSTMKSGKVPDAYLACDNSFVPPVQELFFETIEISETDMVIIVPKGNPKDVHELKDLTQAGLSLGFTNPEQSALGALTRDLLREVGIYEDITQNDEIRFSYTPTADLLVNQVITGSLDAAIVYRANCAKVLDEVDVVRIDHPKAHAIQPFAIARESRHQQLMKRFRDLLTSRISRERFEEVGFRWRAGAD